MRQGLHLRDEREKRTTVRTAQKTGVQPPSEMRIKELPPSERGCSRRQHRVGRQRDARSTPVSGAPGRRPLASGGRGSGAGTRRRRAASARSCYGSPSPLLDTSKNRRRKQVSRNTFAAAGKERRTFAVSASKARPLGGAARIPEAAGGRGRTRPVYFPQQGPRRGRPPGSATPTPA